MAKCCEYDVRFDQTEDKFDVGFAQHDDCFPVDFGEMQIIPIERNHYTGAVTVIPSRERQTLATKNLIVDDDITVEPIPPNYGLITWNGVTLTVS